MRGQEVTFEERKQRVNAVSKPKLLEVPSTLSFMAICDNSRVICTSCVCVFFAVNRLFDNWYSKMAIVEIWRGICRMKMSSVPFLIVGALRFLLGRAALPSAISSRRPRDTHFMERDAALCILCHVSQRVVTIWYQRMKPTALKPPSSAASLRPTAF